MTDAAPAFRGALGELAGEILLNQDDIGVIPLAEGFLELLDSLRQDTDPAEAAARAIRACREAAEWQRAEEQQAQARQCAEDERWKLRAEQIRRLQAANHERAQAQAQAAMGITCPFCGSAPGVRCRSTGPIGNSLTYVHRPRIRHAGMLPWG